MYCPVIPVTLSFDEGRQRWRKQPRVEWDRATTDPSMLAGWWQIWPDALPGIPLRLTDLVVVDADTPEAVEEMAGLRMLGPHSRVATPSGGLHLVFAQPPERIETLSLERRASKSWARHPAHLLRPRRIAVPTRRSPSSAARDVLAAEGRRLAGGGLGSLRGSGGPGRVNKEPGQRGEQMSQRSGYLTAALWEMDAVDWRGELR